MDIRLNRRGRIPGFDGVNRLDLALDGGLEQRWAEHHPPQKIESAQGKHEGDADAHEIAGMQAGEKAGFTFFHGAFIQYCDGKTTGPGAFWFWAD